MFSVKNRKWEKIKFGFVGFDFCRRRRSRRRRRRPNGKKEKRRGGIYSLIALSKFESRLPEKKSEMGGNLHWWSMKEQKKKWKKSTNQFPPPPPPSTFFFFFPWWGKNLDLKHSPHFKFFIREEDVKVLEVSAAENLFHLMTSRERPVNGTRFWSGTEGIFCHQPMLI